MIERRPPIKVKVELVETDGDTVTVDLETSAGSLRVLADVSVVGRIAYASGLHIQGNDVGKNAFGWTSLRALGWAVLDWLGDDYDELVIKGAVRTSGANPGRRPGDLRFTRRLRPTSDAT
jgi:hypothetical protein